MRGENKAALNGRVNVAVCASLPLSVMDAPAFLATVLNNGKGTPSVTLTFAQSLDAKIAGKGGKQLILSGKESMVMTHWCGYRSRRISHSSYYA